MLAASCDSREFNYEQKLFQHKICCAEQHRLEPIFAHTSPENSRMNFFEIHPAVFVQ